VRVSHDLTAASLRVSGVASFLHTSPSMRSEDFAVRIQSSSVYTLASPSTRKPDLRKEVMSTIKAMIARLATWLIDRLAFRHSKRTSSARVRVRDVQTAHSGFGDEVARFEDEGGTGNDPRMPRRA
jgi:hypothetical protein